MVDKSMRFRDRIRAAYDDLSPSFQKLADYLSDHPFEAAFMTATELGRHLDVDTATVVRFAQRLDYPGFPELLDEVQDEVRAQLVRYFQPAQTDVDQGDVLRAAIRQDLRNLERFELTVDTDALEWLMTSIDGARRVWVVGDGMTSKPIAHLLANHLRILTFNAMLLPTDAATVASEFLDLTSQDLVVAVAVTEYCPDATSIMDLARSRGARTFGFVGAQSWPIARAVESSVVCPHQSPSKGSSTSTFAVAIQALFQALYARHRTGILGQYNSFEQAMHQITESRGDYQFMPPPWAPDDNGVKS